MTLILPKDYRPTLTVRDTEAAIVFIRETFQDIYSWRPKNVCSNVR